MKTKTESKNETIMGFDRFLIVVLVITLLAMGIQAVSAETISGSLGESGYNSTLYTETQTGATGGFLQKLFAGQLQQTSGTTTLVLWTIGVATYDAGAPAGATTPFQMKLADNNGVVLGTGTMGYQRRFTTGGTEQPGYIWLQFTNYTTGGYTGNRILWINYSRNDLYNITYAKTSGSYAPNPNLGWCDNTGACTPIAGDYNHVKDVSTTVDYTATKPSGIGISGSITKTLGLSQAFVFNSSGNSISSEYTASSNTFNFTVSNDQIIIGIYTSAGIWYNSSLLFTPGGITPTPTPTPTATPPPTGTFNANFAIKNNGNNTAIQNAYVELHRHDAGNSINTGYTNSSGLISFLGIPFPTYAQGYDGMAVWVYKTGYQFQTYDFTPTGDIYHSIYLLPDIGPDPLIPATANITVHSIDASNGNANLANAYVELYPNVPGYNGIIDWTYKLTGFTNATGRITFNNVPTSARLEIKTTKTGYSVNDWWIDSVPLSDFTHTAYLTTFGVTPTPTPLPQTGNYTLVISPTTVPYNGNTTGTISSVNDPTLADIQQIWYAYGDPMSDPVNAFDFFESGSYSKALQYIKTGGNWMGWDYATNTFSNNKGATIPNPNDLIFNGPGGTKTVYCTITLTNGIQYDLLGTVVVGAGAGQITTNVHSIDALTGGQLFNVKIDILNENTGAWKNGTYPAGQASITTPAGTYLSFYGYLAGWNNATSLHKIAVASPSYQLRFYETGVSPGVGNQTFHITVEDQSGNPLSGAVVAITEVGNATQTKATAEGGTTSFTLKQSTTYTYRVTKIGYSIGAGSFSTDTADVGSTHIQLTKLAVTTPPTPTITPVIIPTGTAGNYSGFWGPIAEGAKGAGAATNEIPLLLAALLIFIGFCVGGWSGAAYSPNSAFNGQASLGGGVFGFVLSCMFGFIPIVWVISIIIIGIFVFIFFTRS